MSVQRPANSRVRHGQAACADYGCKKPECLRARRERQKRNKYLLSTGRPGNVGPERAAAHIKKFRAAGVSDTEAMTLFGMARSSFYRLLRGEDITRDTEQRVLAVPVPPKRQKSSNLAAVDASGTRRRIQALVALGWPQNELARRLSVHCQWLSAALLQTRVAAKSADAVRALYDQLWDAVPELDGIPAFHAARARETAAQRGWVSPLAWDDDTIDDPTAVPVTDAAAPPPATGADAAARWLMGESVVLDPASRREVIQHLMEWTDQTVEQIARRLEMEPDTLSRSWERIKKRARDAGKPAPWRRVYLPLGDMDLNKDDLSKTKMESAA